MTDLESRVQALQHYVLVLATALKNMQMRQELESSLTNVRICECVQRDDTLIKECTQGFLAITTLLQGINRRLSDGPEWNSDFDE
jgi:hypothetical protein